MYTNYFIKNLLYTNNASDMVQILIKNITDKNMDMGTHRRANLASNSSPFQNAAGNSIYNLGFRTVLKILEQFAHFDL